MSDLVTFIPEMLTKSDGYTKEYIEQVHNDLTMAVNILASEPKQQGFRQAVANFRKIDVKYFDELNCFYVKNPEEIRTLIGDTLYTNTDLGFISKTAYPTFRERFVFPCYNQRKKVIGMVGYDNVHHYKYLLSSTLGFNKVNASFGYQDLEYIYKCGYVIIVEGIMDWVRLRSLGYPVYCLQGLSIYPNQLRIFKRLKGVIALLDADKAGLKALSYIKKQLANCTAIQLYRGKLDKMDSDMFFQYEENIVSLASTVETIQENWKHCNFNPILLYNSSEILEEKIIKYGEELEEYKKSLENTNTVKLEEEEPKIELVI